MPTDQKVTGLSPVGVTEKEANFSLPFLFVFSDIG